MSSPPIDRDQVRVLFGSMVEVMAHHELFYTALTTRTMDWGPKQTIGNIFMTVSTLHLSLNSYIHDFKVCCKIGTTLL